MTREQIQKKLKEVENQTSLLDLSQHKALGFYIVVVPAIIHEGGVTSRVVQHEDRPEIGLVVAIGDEVTKVEVGNVVFFGKYSTTQLTYDGQTHYILREDDVYSIAQ